MRKILSIILVCGMIMAVFAGCMFGGGNVNNDELTPASSVSMSEDEANGLKDKTPVQLYFINEQGSKLSQETRYIKNSETTKGSAYLATAILKELINGPAKGSLLQASIPQGTTVHAEVSIKDGVASVDLSKEFIDKHPGGKKKEQLTLYSIVNTLTEIKDIKSVQFKIDGKVRKEFKGSYQIDAAYPRSAYLISAQPADNISKIQPSKEEIKVPVKEEIKAPAKEELKAPAKEEIKAPEIKAPTKEEITPEKKSNLDTEKSSEDVETNAELLE